MIEMWGKARSQIGLNVCSTSWRKSDANVLPSHGQNPMQMYHHLMAKLGAHLSTQVSPHWGITDRYFGPYPYEFPEIQWDGSSPNSVSTNWGTSTHWNTNSIGFGLTFDYSNMMPTTNLRGNNYNPWIDWACIPVRDYDPDAIYYDKDFSNTDMILNSDLITTGSNWGQVSFLGSWYPNNLYRMMPQYPKSYPDLSSFTSVYLHDDEIVKITPPKKKILMESHMYFPMDYEHGYYLLGYEPYPSNNMAMW